jgi:dTDP-4-amino-4,6-dideoxygalactose transaminase
MDRATWILNRRRQVAARYDTLLTDVEWLRPQATPPEHRHGYQAYVCLFGPGDPSLERIEELRAERNRVMATAEQRGVATRQGTHAPVTTGYYADKYDLRLEEFPNAVIAEGLTITLPLYPQMTHADQDLVIETLVEATGRV